MARTGSTAGPAAHRHGGSTGEDSHRVLCGCLESGCHDRLVTMPPAEPGSSLDTLDPSSAGASASSMQPLHLEHDVQESEFLNCQIRYMEKLGT